METKINVHIFVFFLKVLASVFFSKFCCDVYAFHKMLFFLLLLSSVSGVAHFIHASTAYFLSWMPCYRCKQRITIIGLQTYSNILIEGILLKMLRNKREFYLEQAISFYFVWPVHFALLTLCKRSKKIFEHKGGASVHYTISPWT